MSDDLKPQDTGELACWISDEVDPRMIEHWKGVVAPTLFKQGSEDAGVVVGPISFHELKPGEGRAGQPPEGFQGTNVRLLVATAIVLGFKPHHEGTNFLLDLDPKDLGLLRKITRRAALPHQLSDEETDQVIMRYGPVTAQKLLKSAVDDKLLH